MAETLSSFLSIHRVDKISNPHPITHTRIGDSKKEISGGSYHIPDEELKKFYDLYCDHVFTKGRNEYLTEVQLESGAIAVDFDFRFPYDTTTRLHNSDEVFSMMCIYLEKLNQIYTFQSDTTFPVFIFEKPSVNRVQDKNITKDGLHMIIGVNADRVVQKMLREAVMEDLQELWGHLPHTNNWESILDAGITSGKTNWQLYGSRKPGFDAYALTHYYTIEYVDGEITPIKEKLEGIQIRPLYPMMSVQYKSHRVLNLNPAVLEVYNKVKENMQKPAASQSNAIKPRLKLKIRSNQPTPDDIDIFTIRNKEQLEASVKIILDSIHPSEFNIREAHEYAQILPEKYFGRGSYDRWIKVGWALKNTDPRLFLSWVLFSSKSPDFVFSDIPKFFEMWERFEPKSENRLTERSIMYWAHTDAEKEYKLVRNATVAEYKKEAIMNPTHYAFAKVLYCMYKDEYKCASIENKQWYQYINHRWTQVDSAVTLRNRISEDVWEIFHSELQILFKHKYTSPAPQILENATLEEKQMERERKEKQSELDKKIDKLTKICTDLRMVQYKDNIIREAMSQFYDKDFTASLDENKYLLCFNNGVVDFNAKIPELQFRQGYPEDYISKSTNIDYIPYDYQTNEKIIRQITVFMEQLFPLKELNNYMWEHLASVLIGGNINQVFNIYTGSGRNGKSLLVSLMEKILGDYKAVVPLPLLTGKRIQMGQTCTELVQLKGVRYAVAQENEKDVVINEGTMKELTGNTDKIQARGLYQSKMTIYEPQFKLILCTNNLPIIKSNDGGTWRRLHVNPFMSFFTEKPEPTKESPYQYKVDLKMGEKVEEWKEIFMSMLVKLAFEKMGEVSLCDIVLSASNDYRASQDHVSQFVKECVVYCADNYVKPTELNEEYNRWYMANHGSKPSNKKDLSDYMDTKFGKRTTKGWKNITIAYDEEESNSAAEQC